MVIIYGIIMYLFLDAIAISCRKQKAIQERRKLLQEKQQEKRRKEESRERQQLQQQREKQRKAAQNEHIYRMQYENIETEIDRLQELYKHYETIQNSLACNEKQRIQIEKQLLAIDKRIAALDIQKAKLYYKLETA